MEVYKCMHCGFEFDEPARTYDGGHYDEDCPNCGSEDIERTEESESAYGWKKAWKELPEDNKRYLTITAHGNAEVIEFNVKHQAWNVSDDDTDTEIKVLYWMPIPPMPHQKQRPAYDVQHDADLIKKAMELKEEGK